MTTASEKIRAQLLILRDESNAHFVSKLIPTLDSARILGGKTPILRIFAKQYRGTQDRVSFLQDLPHYYLEENAVHAYFIEQEKDFEQAMTLTEAFLPHIDNWATCDSFLPAVFKKYPEQVLEKVQIWLKSPHTYTVRYGIGILISCYLDAHFQPEFLRWVASVQSDDYYVQMMQARYFATALAKQETATLALIQSQTLPPFVQNKTIQKARESRRISPELKHQLLNSKIKK